MEVNVITGPDIRAVSADELPDALARGEGAVWVDVPTWDQAAARILDEVFGFHPLAIRDCEERNRVPKVHAYADHLFVVVHAPERGPAGHVHYVELDQFVGPGYVVTVHGPVNPAVPPAASLRDEQRVMGGHLGNPEHLLDELFRARHGLLAVRTMAARAGEIYARVVTLSRYVPPEGRPLVNDVVDQFERIRSLAEQEKDYLQGVIEFYQTRTDTKMTIAAERLAVIAVVTLPVTALASVFGMNLIVNDRTTPLPLLLVVLVMAGMSGLLLLWAKRRGWW